MLALMRFVWERIKDIHDAAWILPNAVVATVCGIGVSIWAAADKVPGYLWIPLGLFTCILFMHFAYMFLEAREHLIRSPLEIIFDSANPQRHFWSIIPINDNNGVTIASQWEYRAIIRNASSKTVRNVKAVVEAIGPMPTMPEPALFHIGSFDSDRKFIMDLAPKEKALATIRRWYNPIIVAGMVCGEDVYGPIKMTVNADDVPPRVKIFHFDPEKIPAVYE